MKEVKAVINAYPHDGDMAKKPNSILFQFGREISFDEGSQTELRLGLVQIQVALDESNGGEICQMCSSSNMAIYAIEMTKLEVNGNLVMLQPESFQLFSNKDDFIMKCEIDNWPNFHEFTQFHSLPKLCWGGCGCGLMYHNRYFVQCRNQSSPIMFYFLWRWIFRLMKVKGDGFCSY